MRIVIDLQGAQTASRWRGIGRYSMSLAQAITRNPGRHEIWLAMNGSFPEAVLDIRRAFQGLIPRERIHIFRTPLSAGEEHTSYPGLTRAAEKIREYSLAGLKPDVVLLTSFFEGFYDQAVTSIGSLVPGMKTAVILYDLIPLLHPELYFENRIYRDHYLRKIKWLRKADMLLSISENSRREALENLEADSEEIRTISAALDGSFKPLAISQIKEAAFREHYGISRKPILCASGGFDLRKNLERLICAYSMLPKDLRAEYQLVISGKVEPEIFKKLGHLGELKGLGQEDLVFTGYVPDEDMPVLYNLAVLSVFPSLSEGLGLPVLESMACGTPVIASDIPSITEIMEYPDAQFDPHSTDSIKEWLERYLRDESCRTALGAHGLKQAANHSWGNCARDVLEALENLNCNQNANSTEKTFQTPETEDLLSSIADIEGLPADDHMLRRLSRSIAGSALPEKRSRQLLIDISTIYFEDIKTGIQRVVRAQLLELIKNPPEGFLVEPVYLDNADKRWLYRHAGSYLGYLFGIGKLCLPNHPVDIQSGDILYLPDYAPYPVATAAEDSLYLQLKAERVSINAVVYDLLPVLRPKFFNDATVLYHEKLLRAFARFADQVICISAAVAAEMSAWIKREEPEWQKDLIINSLHLGADIEASAPTFRDTRREGFLPEPSFSGSAFLMVGTVEPRKGHLQALAAFDLLWKENEDVTLLIVGREGWTNVTRGERKTIPSIVRAVREHPELNRRLFWMDDASDDLLIEAYDSSTCLLAASEGEGFGLPLIEAARHGLPIITRDIPVFREVAEDNAFYFRGLDPESLAAAITEWLELYKEGKHPQSKGLRWSTWEENAENLKGLLIQGSKIQD